MKKTFDYYIFIDYSENLIGYIIIENKNIRELIPKILKFHHYRNLKHKREYLHSIKKRFEKEKLTSYIFKYKIDNIWYNMDVFAEIVKFIDTLLNVYRKQRNEKKKK